jgi:hypothetical protein
MTTINRAPYNLLVDDPGDNLTGTTWNKQQIKDVLLDPIDVALAAFSGPVVFPSTAVPSANPNALDDYEEGVWTPIDRSGAGLALTGVSGSYIKIGQMVFAAGNVAFPANANGAQATIGGLPFASPATPPYWGSTINYTTCNLALTLMQFIGDTAVSIFGINGAAISNAQLAGHSLRFTAIYRAAS